MKKIFLLTTLIAIYTSSTSAQSWIAIPGNAPHKKNFVYDSQSIKNYPGMVVVDTRYDIPAMQGIKEQSVFHRLAYLCGSKEIYGIASYISASKSPNRAFIPEVGNQGFLEHMMIPNLLNTLSKFCGGRTSREKIEIPLTTTNTDITFMLPRETLINGFRVVMWEKKYSYTRQPMVINGEEIRVGGEPLYNYTINRDSSYELSSWEYDCSTKSSALLHKTDYDSNSKPYNSQNYSNNKSFTQVIPGSIGQSLLEFACGLR